MKVTTTYTTSDGKTWTDQAAAERHEDLLERIAVYCEQRAIRSDRAVALRRIIILSWEYGDARDIGGEPPQEEDASEEVAQLEGAA